MYYDSLYNDYYFSFKNPRCRPSNFIANLEIIDKNNARVVNIVNKEVVNYWEIRRSE